MAERLITLNIRRYLVRQPRPKRARRAMRYIRERVAHYTKIVPENIRIGQDVNNAVFKHYAKYMNPIKLRVLIGTDTADVLMFKEGESADAKAAAKPNEKTAKENKKEDKKEKASSEDKEKSKNKQDTAKDVKNNKKV